MQCINIEDVFLALVDLALDPVSVEIFEKVVVVPARRRVSFPLLDVIGE